MILKINLSTGYEHFVDEFKNVIIMLISYVLDDKKLHLFDLFLRKTTINVYLSTVKRF